MPCRVVESVELLVVLIVVRVQKKTKEKMNFNFAICIPVCYEYKYKYYVYTLFYSVILHTCFDLFRSSSGAYLQYQAVTIVAVA